ncbi:hypothetical protein GCM10011371_07520 [Novosphingobium marinum]|uniref:Uncharacterized protein YbaA (DUF1428 family) n=1 Tax=Novosphingobium marinum TaxID=1514948 RepID=A0A7Y9XTS1_9SPHN|nr:DUF1428 domain-containing protein [Novosphingobium marinum]NYH94439.1 uncharacterized protein YbaA (DUF1428 family) [Novosphingobium marinum]GGC22360.1 hypothetical protein GCM10011371_07520 [Novosphingobium marinum]
MYIQGFLIPVPEGRKEDYRALAEKAAEMFREYGVLEIVEGWEEDVPDGTHTDFRKACKAEAGEKIVFSWMIWPDRETCDAAAKKMETDERWQMPPDMPFDGKRMIFGGFAPIFTHGR